ARPKPVRCRQEGRFEMAMPAGGWRTRQPLPRRRDAGRARFFATGRPTFYALSIRTAESARRSELLFVVPTNGSLGRRKVAGGFLLLCVVAGVVPLRVVSRWRIVDTLAFVFPGIAAPRRYVPLAQQERQRDADQRGREVRLPGNAGVDRQHPPHQRP